MTKGDTYLLLVGLILTAHFRRPLETVDLLVIGACLLIIDIVARQAEDVT
jgi:hypothetical protein